MYPLYDDELLSSKDDPLRLLADEGEVVKHKEVSKIIAM